ncbi:hypothetical protein TNCV_2116791 [Trichonephila clavipes]|nr:hypothetical protein TNCV_2116791 [Trichonephila clavipes]
MFQKCPVMWHAESYWLGTPQLKRCRPLLQRIPVHLGIRGNECVDARARGLAKEARNLYQTCHLGGCKHGCQAQNFYHQRFIKPTIPELNYPKNLLSTVVRLPTGHFKSMKISLDNYRSYPTCRNCPEAQLTPDYIFDCMAILAFLFKLGASPGHSLQSSSPRSGLACYRGF